MNDYSFKIHKFKALKNMCYNPQMREIWGQYQRGGMHLADLHIHTNVSPDAREGMTPGQAVELAERIGIDTIAITDHDTFESSLSAWNTSQRRNSPVTVVPGMEVTSKDGHVIALFLRDPIPTNMPIDETIEAIHGQGGLAILPHPEFTLIQSVRKEKALKLAAKTSTRPDGIEIFNGGVFDYAMRKILSGKKFPTTANQEAYGFYKKNSAQLGASIASSDAHRKTFGRFVTGYEYDLYRSITNSTTVALARSMTGVRQIIESSADLFGSEFDLERIQEWIGRIEEREDEYFSYLGK